MSVRKTYNQEVVEDRDNYKFVCSGPSEEVYIPPPQPKPLPPKVCNCECHQIMNTPPPSTYQDINLFKTVNKVNHSCPYCQGKNQQAKAPTFKSFNSNMVRSQPRRTDVVSRGIECPTCKKRRRESANVQPRTTEFRSQPLRTSVSKKEPTFTKSKDVNTSFKDRYIYTEQVKPTQKKQTKYVSCQDTSSALRAYSQPKKCACPICEAEKQVTYCPKHSKRSYRAPQNLDNYKFTEIKGTCPPRKRHGKAKNDEDKEKK